MCEWERVRWPAPNVGCLWTAAFGVRRGECTAFGGVICTKRVSSQPTWIHGVGKPNNRDVIRLSAAPHALSQNFDSQTLADILEGSIADKQNSAHDKRYYAVIYLKFGGRLQKHSAKFPLRAPEYGRGRGQCGGRFAGEVKVSVLLKIVFVNFHGNNIDKKDAVR